MKATLLSHEKPTIVQAVGLALLIEATGVVITLFLWRLVEVVTI